MAKLMDGRSESPGESISRWLLEYLGFPRPELQVELNSFGALVRVDFFWREYGLVGEFDGRVKYGRLLAPGQDGNDVLFKEKRREDGLRAEGYLVIRWVWDDLGNLARFREIVRRGLELATLIRRPATQA